MTAKEYLETVELMDLAISQLQEEIADLRERSTSISSTNFGAPERGKGGRKTSAPYAAIIEKLVDLEMLVAKKIEKLAFRKRRVINQIHRLSNPLYIRVLYGKYVQYKALPVLADELNYSHSHMRRVLAEALDAFEAETKKMSKNNQK